MISARGLRIAATVALALGLVALLVPPLIQDVRSQELSTTSELKPTPQKPVEEESAVNNLTRDLVGLLPPILVILGGGWALYRYWVTRRGQVTVGIEPTVRLNSKAAVGRALLYVRLRISNPSSVLYVHREATATLFDASKLTPGGALRLAPFSQQDPFLPVYGEMSTDPAAIADGNTFVLDSEISLEPGEFVNTELAFVLDPQNLGPMALRVLIQGVQQRWLKRSRPYWWGSFIFIDPGSVRELEPAAATLASKENTHAPQSGQG